MSKRRVTINDVAREAGVSKSTVSMVLGNYKAISEATKAKVNKVIKELNFVPSVTARQLSTGKSNKIAIISYRMAAPFQNEILRGFEEKFYERIDRDYSVDFYTTEGKEDIKRQILLDILHGKKADGVVLITLKVPDDLQELYKEYKIPILMIEQRSDVCNWIDVDSYRGGELAAQHFIKKGKTKCGIVNAKNWGLEVGDFATERYRGFVDTLKKNSIEFNEEHHWQLYDLITDASYSITDEIIKSGVEAVFCAAGDYVTTGIYARCKELRVNIPKDLSVIGYDNIFYTELISPTLTTIAQPLYEIGQKSFEIIYEQIKEHKSLSKKILLKPKLIARESSL